MRGNVFDQVGVKKMFADFSDAYEMIAETPAYKRKMRKRHHERGAFRSGEGTPEQIMERLRKFEEEQTLDEYERNGTVPVSHVWRDKLFNRFHKTLGDKKGVIADDKHDLEPMTRVFSDESAAELSLAGKDG